MNCALLKAPGCISGTVRETLLTFSLVTAETARVEAEKRCGLAVKFVMSFTFSFRRFDQSKGEDPVSAHRVKRCLILFAFFFLLIFLASFPLTCKRCKDVTYTLGKPHNHRCVRFPRRQNVT